MPRKSLPMDEDEKARYQKLYKRLKLGSEVSDEERVFFAAMRQRCKEAGVDAKDPEIRDVAAEVDTKVDTGEPEHKGTSTKPPEEQAAPKKPRGKRPPMQVEVPPDKLAAAVIAGTYAIEKHNREKGFPGMPDMWFPVAQMLLQDWFEELAAKGWDLRKFRVVILGGGFGVIGARGIQLLVRESKQKKAADVRHVSAPANGVAEQPTEDKPPHTEGSTLRGDEV